MKNKAVIWLANILILLVFSSTWSFAAPIKDAGEDAFVRPEGEPAIKAVSAILADCERGQILYEKGEHTPLHIASLCKLMTVLLAVQSGNLNASITISKDSVDADGSALNLVVGEKYPLEELTYGIMLTSANDAAISVAEYISGDTESFVKKMNEMAQKLSMKETFFRNPTGLYDEAQYTTAYDVMLFINYAIKNPDFYKIFSTQVHPWNNLNTTSKVLTSQNKLFWSYDGVDGGKTGFNKKEQQSIITTAVRGNMKLVCVVLDSPEKEMFNDAIAVFDYGFSKYRKSILVKKDDILKTVKVNGNDIDLICTEDIYYIHPIGENFIKEFSTTADIQPPISKSKMAGTARYVLKDSTIIDIGLYPATEILPPDDFYTSIKKKIAENKDIFYLVIFLLIIEAIMIIVNLIRLINRLVGKIVQHKKKQS